MTIREMQERKKKFGLSYEMISKKSGIPLGTVQKVLGGITKSPRYETLAALEKVLSKPKNFWSESIDYAEGTGIEENSLKENGAEENNLTESQTTGNCVKKTYADIFAGSSALTGGMVCEDTGCYSFGTSARKWTKLDSQGKYTVKDYCALPNDQRYELIDGVLYAMPSPSISHQEIAGELYAQLRNYIRTNKGKCKALISPVDVQLDADDWTIMQPDVLILCNQEKVYEGKRIVGAPDFVVEVLSDSTALRDLTIKMYKYRKAGVREYWIVDPENKYVTTYLFEIQKTVIYTFDEKISLGIYEGKCEIDLSDIV